PTGCRLGATRIWNCCCAPGDQSRGEAVKYNAGPRERLAPASGPWTFQAARRLGSAWAGRPGGSDCPGRPSQPDRPQRAHRRQEPTLAAIDDLIAQIQDPRLRADLEREWAQAKKTRKFGLVFDRHLPELVPIPQARPRRGGLVAKKGGSLADLWRVRRVAGGIAHCVRPEGAPAAGDPWELPLDELRRRARSASLLVSGSSGWSSTTQKVSQSLSNSRASARLLMRRIDLMQALIEQGVEHRRVAGTQRPGGGRRAAGVVHGGHDRRDDRQELAAKALGRWFQVIFQCLGLANEMG
ncbi:MAG TPA: hypothetical protein VES73_16625, partial [Lamprocystis sp. (in: g-proteobacteria)]|nr:hypothetical protein [Lamprocystis sp. (in: g-proteobacteria)]